MQITDHGQPFRITGLHAGPEPDTYLMNKLSSSRVISPCVQSSTLTACPQPLCRHVVEVFEALTPPASLTLSPFRDLLVQRIKHGSSQSYGHDRSPGQPRLVNARALERTCTASDVDATD